MIKGIIFDLDGVICSTDEYHYLAWLSLANKEGIYFDKEINNKLRGVSRMDSLNIILSNSTKTYSEEEKIKLAEYKNDIYKSYLLKMKPTDISSDVLFTLHKLKELGYKVAIGSSSKNTKLILSQLNIIDLFDAISDGTLISKSKPDPEVFLLAAKMLGLSSDECIVVEDAKAGVEAGKRGGFLTIGIGDAYKDKNSDISINKLSDIIKILSKHREVD